MNCIFYLSLLFLSVKGQVIIDGPCNDTVPVADNFDSEQFAGKWYEIHRTPNQYQSGDCSYFDFEKVVGANWTEFDIQHRIINENFLEDYQATSSLVDPAKFIVSLENFEKDIDFWILLTLHNEFALAYSCETLYPEPDDNVTSPQSSINLWKLGRRTFYGNENNINSLMNIHIEELFGIDATQVMYNVSHTDNACYILPKIEDGEDVIIPGQCADIPVLHNIDYEAFSGLWHTLGSYDYDTKEGNCLNTRYTFNSIDDIKVLNTRVIDEVLYNETGTVTIGENGAFIFAQDSDDEQKREVFLIDTDYVSYAISYNCENIGENQRRIHSQIMTRSRQVSQQTKENIDQVLHSYIELNSRYYNYIDQSDASCFYFPEPIENQPVIFRGQCDMNMKNVDNFNMNEFEGIWHVIEGYPNKEMTGSCLNYEFSVDKENSAVMHFLNTRVSEEILLKITGSKTLDNGVFIMNIDNVKDHNKESSNLYSWVLGTDYNSYALIYSCINLNEDERAVWSWKISREKHMSPQGNEAIDNIMNTIPVLDQQYYQTEDQSEDGCFFFPRPIKGEPVIFPGQCDENIAVFSNFDLLRFQGVWNEIEAYPKTQQSGKCINLDFKVHDNNLNFSISEVYDQFLQTNLGSLTFTSSDGLAKFIANVNFGGEDYSIPFWILATDYEDYALAYSCVNINRDFRGIWSWKLSRTRYLSDAANTAFNEVISKVVVLGEEYYEDSDHSDEACFYLPDLQPGEPVVIRGNCDPNIPVVNNFDKTAYEGLWYEIESYFDELQDGECQDTTYQITDSGHYNVIGSQVVNTVLDTLSASAILSSDGTAKFEITTTRESTNETITSIYWILSTDYVSYSLVYSCENLNPDERRVKSWKLSRQRQLSPEAKDIINGIIDTVPVLHSQYYRVVDHNDAACFYYPEFTGEPVTFRGQCSENIPVVENFQVDRYLGDWYDVESYPQFFQKGTCPLANYDILDETTIEVRNTEVIEQELSIAIGEARLATDDGSAKLKVSFAGAGKESNYWVLATDYINYALVYSCANISPDRRAVSSWKLSREATLSSSSEAAIDVVINSVDVLSQDYYIKRGHSEEDCFHYPDNNGGPVLLEGLCSDSVNENHVQPFDANRFSGDWYEISRFPSELQTGMCAKLHFSNGLRDLTASIINDERQSEVSGSVISHSADGYFVMQFPNEDDIKVYILDTDYSDFALTYSCKNYNTTHRQVYSWKLGKNKNGLNQESNERINVIVREHMDLFHGYYEETGQDDYACFHYPKFENPSVIELPGPCNDTIRGIANFNRELFEGIWYETARYPTNLQKGECARFSCNSQQENYIVRPSSVKDEILTEVYGIGTVPSDGSGVLRIKFDVEDDYYILDTDYFNYALIYNCRNLPNGNRQVSSWKLSRNTNLEEEYEDLLAPIIKNTQGLLEEYFIGADQSDESCFYIPDSNNDGAVIFRGECDQNIHGVANFNIQAYLGWWHEIEGYLTGRRSLDCISYRYEQISGQLRVSHTEIFRGTAVIVNGTMQVTDDGRLRKTFSYIHENGTLVEEVREMLVLATDYNTYSLLYSCENLKDGYRKVWSGKYSKKRQLTPEAQETMQPFIDSNRVLYNQFYFDIGQSDDECFYYPEQHGPYIVIPGQCDLNIPVLRNFDLEAYSNTWYLIEDYPHPDQKGQCSGTIYNPRGEPGDFRVRNFQLISEEEELEIEEGTGTLTSTDGTARMRIVREVPELERAESLGTEVFVLASDYESYSLVYTCRNIDEFHRYVGVWKLSRTRSLTSAAVAAINNLINERQELYQPYFSSVRQDDDCPSAGHTITSTLVLFCISIPVLFLTY